MEKRSESIRTHTHLVFPIVQIYLVIMIALFQATVVRAPTSAADFSLGQSAPFDPTGAQVQDADAGCGGTPFDTGNLGNHDN